MEDSTEHLAESGTDGVSVHSGFPNPAADRRGQGQVTTLDFNRLLIQNPSSTYCFRIRGHGHEDRGIFDGDIAVIDRACSPHTSDLILYWRDSTFALSPYNQAARQECWGVVTAIIHVFRTKNPPLELSKAL